MAIRPTGDVVTTSRKLEEISSNLDDMSVTLEEIKDEVKNGETRTGDKLDKVQAEMEKATDMIDDSLIPEKPEK
jgi:methyl-accepting chemotaxis protein